MTPNSAAHVKNRFFPYLLGGGIIIALVFGGLGSWGVTAPIASAVIASGQVMVDTNRKEIAHLEGGIINEIFVRDGAQVEAGDLLVRMDQTNTQARMAVLESRLTENMALLARLEAEANNAEHITYPDELLAKKHIPSVTATILGQSDLFEARKLTVSGQIDILNRRIEQVKQEIVAFEEQASAEARRKEIIDQEIDVLAPLFDQGHVSQQRILALRREAVQMEGAIGSIKANIARSRQTIGETRLQIIQLKKEAQQAVLAEMGDVQRQLKEVREQYAAVSSILERTEVTAPVSGTIVNLSVHSEGAVVRPGETFLEIVPDQDALLVEVRVDPQDIDTVAIGLTSQIRLTAFRQRTTPLLNGDVVYVSPDSFQDERSGIPFYRARITVSNEELEKLNDARLSPGMPAEVMINTGSRTALQYIMQPITESMTRAWREE